MATAKQIRDYRRAQSDVVQLAERELRSFYRSLNKEDALATARALKLFIPDLISEYGDIGATVAADFYEQLREDSPNVSKRYTATIGEPIPAEQIIASTGWAIGPLFRELTDESAAYSNLVDVTDRLIKQQGRNTIDYNSRNDPAQVRYARVPTGADTCEFCLMLASRGAVYMSADSAGEINTYHGRCDCVPTPVWSNDDYAELKQSAGYDPDEYFERWQDSKSQ